MIRFYIKFWALSDKDIELFCLGYSSFNIYCILQRLFVSMLKSIKNLNNSRKAYWYFVFWIWSLQQKKYFILTTIHIIHILLNCQIILNSISSWSINHSWQSNKQTLSTFNMLFFQPFWSSTNAWESYSSSCQTCHNKH